MCGGEAPLHGSQIQIQYHHVRVTRGGGRVAGDGNAGESRARAIDIGQVRLQLRLEDNGQGFRLDAVDHLIGRDIPRAAGEHVAVHQNGIVGFFRDVDRAVIQHQIHRVAQFGSRSGQSPGWRDHAIGRGGVFNHIQAAIISYRSITHIADHQRV